MLYVFLCTVEPTMTTRFLCQWSLYNRQVEAAEMISGHGRVFSGLLTLAEGDSTDAPARCLRPPCDPFGKAEIQELWILLIFIIRKVGVALIFLLCPSFTCTRTLMQTQPCCVRVFSLWPQVCEYREDLCATLPLPLLLLCFWTPLLSKDWLPGLILLQSSSHKHKISLRMHLLNHQYLY